MKPLEELHELYARRASANKRPARNGSKLSKILEREREQEKRSKSVAFSLSRKLVEKEDREIARLADKLRESQYGHSFVRDILGAREQKREGEPLLGFMPNITHDPD